MSETESRTEEPEGRTYYDVLGVPASADRDSVRIAYRTRMVELQPEAWRGSEADRRAEAARVNDAWNTLSDQFQRDRYDASLEDGTAARLPAAPSARGGAKDRPRQGGPRVGDVFDVGSGPVPDGYTAVLANRVNAVFLDVMLCFAGYIGFAFVVSLIHRPTATDGKLPPPPAWLTPSFAAFMTLWLVLIFVFPTARWGQTVGQRWFGIRVVRSRDGQLPGLTRTLYRYGPLVVLSSAGILTTPFLILVPFLLGLTFMVTRTRRGFPDRAAGTVVVDAVPRPPRIGRRRRPIG
jgi:uncharacterized RDD family membrane protein YckC